MLSCFIIVLLLDVGSNLALTQRIRTPMVHCSRRKHSRKQSPKSRTPKSSKSRTPKSVVHVAEPTARHGVSATRPRWQTCRRSGIQQYVGRVKALLGPSLFKHTQNHLHRHRLVLAHQHASFLRITRTPRVARTTARPNCLYGAKLVMYSPSSIACLTCLM